MSCIDNNTIIESYKRTGSVWKTGQELGISGQSAYSILKKLGVVKKMNLWTESDSEILIKKYKEYKYANRLEELAKELGRTKQFICRQARKLGLTDRHDVVISSKNREHLSNLMKERLKTNGHPRGFLGHKHNEETKHKISQTSKRAWSDLNSKLNSVEVRQKKSDNLHTKKMLGEYCVFSNRGKHRCEIGGKTYVFNSSWEVEIANILQQFLTDGKISSWDYETVHFEFKDVKRGNRSYCPDFEVVLNNNEHIFLEVKGWEMEKSMKRISMFKERYGLIKFYLINGSEYKKILSDNNYLWRRCVEIKPIQDCNS